MINLLGKFEVSHSGLIINQFSSFIRRSIYLPPAFIPTVSSLLQALRLDPDNRPADGGFRPQLLSAPSRQSWPARAFAPGSRFPAGPFPIPSSNARARLQHRSDRQAEPRERARPRRRAPTADLRSTPG